MKNHLSAVIIFRSTESCTTWLALSTASDWISEMCQNWVRSFRCQRVTEHVISRTDLNKTLTFTALYYITFFFRFLFKAHVHFIWYTLGAVSWFNIFSSLQWGGETCSVTMTTAKPHNTMTVTKTMKVTPWTGF